MNDAVDDICLPTDRQSSMNAGLLAKIRDLLSRERHQFVLIEVEEE